MPKTRRPDYRDQPRPSLRSATTLQSRALLLDMADGRPRADARTRDSRAASNLYCLGLVTNPDGPKFQITDRGRLALVELAVTP